MEDSTPMTYDNDATTQAYKNWIDSSLGVTLVRHSNFQYFGDLAGLTIVEFGCGTGSFLQTCAAKGAAYCLGLDINDAMIKAGGNIVDIEQHSKQPLHFVIEDCSKSIQKDFGQFDFAVSQFVIHDICSDEQALQIFLNNVIKMLKRGGKFFVGLCPYVAKSQKDQEIIANLCGYLHPMKIDSAGQDPSFAEVTAFRPASTSVSETGRPFTRENMFTFFDYFWSKEKMMINVKEAGFEDIIFLSPSFPDSVSSFEKAQIEALAEPFVLIGAVKPK